MPKDLSKSAHERSVKGFAAAIGVCPATLYNLWRNGSGPKRAKAGTRTIINETPREYLDRLTADGVAKEEVA